MRCRRGAWSGSSSGCWWARASGVAWASSARLRSSHLPSAAEPWRLPRSLRDSVQALASSQREAFRENRPQRVSSSSPRNSCGACWRSVSSSRPRSMRGAQSARRASSASRSSRLLARGTAWPRLPSRVRRSCRCCSQSSSRRQWPLKRYCSASRWLLPSRYQAMAAKAPSSGVSASSFWAGDRPRSCSDRTGGSRARPC